MEEVESHMVDGGWGQLLFVSVWQFTDCWHEHSAEKYLSYVTGNLSSACRAH